NELMVNPAQMTFPANPAVGFIRTEARDFIVNNSSIANGGLDVNGRLQNFGAGGGPAIVALANNTLLIDGLTAPNGTAEWQGHVQYARAQSILRLSAWVDAALGGGSFNDLDLGWAGIRLIRLDTTPAVTVTGIAGANTSGRLLTFYNLGGTTLTFTNQDAASLGANRIITPSGVALVVASFDSVTFYYDDPTARWRVWR
ncbi:MAG TPA: hypothetical protein VJA26_05580, partial [Gammaproteobacteria bacterium]|nr:hypothetical protein [Gammaproteobacteria bacterium]